MRLLCRGCARKRSIYGYCFLVCLRRTSIWFSFMQINRLDWLVAGQKSTMHIAVHLPTHYFRQTKHPQEINGAYYVSGVKDEFVQLWVYLKDTNWTQFVLKSSLSANPNLFKDKMKGFTPFTQSSNSLVAQVIHFSGRVIGFRVGFYLKFKLIVRSGPIMDRLGRVFRFSGTRSSPRRHIWSLDNWTWDNWIHVQMSRSPNIRGGSGLRFSSSGGL